MALLFVGQLPYTNFYDKDLRDLFDEFGTVQSAKIVRKAQFIGFVTFTDCESADRAIVHYHGEVKSTGRRLPLQVMYAYNSKMWSWFGIAHRLLCHRHNRNLRLPTFCSRMPTLSPRSWEELPLPSYLGGGWLVRETGVAACDDASVTGRPRPSTIPEPISPESTSSGGSSSCTATTSPGTGGSRSTTSSSEGRRYRQSAPRPASSSEESSKAPPRGSKRRRESTDEQEQPTQQSGMCDEPPTAPLSAPTTSPTRKERKRRYRKLHMQDEEDLDLPTTDGECECRANTTIADDYHVAVLGSLPSSSSSSLPFSHHSTPPSHHGDAADTHSHTRHHRRQHGVALHPSHSMGQAHVHPTVFSMAHTSHAPLAHHFTTEHPHPHPYPSPHMYQVEGDQGILDHSPILLGGGSQQFMEPISSSSTTPHDRAAARRQRRG